MTAGLNRLLKDIRACQECADKLPHAPRPVLQAAATSRVLIIGQAPGTRVHASGRPFTDPSGDRLRAWMGVDETVFYDENLIAITPMGFCFPGLNDKGADLPPRKECAPLWHERLHALMPNVCLSLLVGGYAQKHHLGAAAKKTLTDTVAAWAQYPEKLFPLPHPSWRNNAWLKKHAWFERDAVPALKHRIQTALKG